ncbi:prominin-2 isoform X1 [Vidua chalybeata]|uniref:prominin-2 isoform X1 n=1 Tax=Vidua chalybeata TaxID=81927 RepID=UPI0023A89D5E|nr:prominin-2 isoform X1 [Vidua chalybeata]
MRAAGLLLAWALLRAAASQQCHPSSPGGVLRFTDRHAEIRVPALHRVPSSLDPLYGLVRRCLDLIQQNPLPTELLRTVLNDPGSVQTSQVVQYELGYVVCAAVALLFTVAVPVAGMCFCYCRSRRRCGGRLRAHRRSLGCRRRCLLACLSFTSLVILVSVTCAFVTSQRVKGQMEPGLGAVPSTLRTLRQHLANVPQGVQMVVDKFEVPRKQIISDLAGLSRSVGLSIHAQLKAITYAALADLQDRARDLQTSLHHLQIVHRTARALAAARAELEPALRERRHRVVALLDDPRCTSCASVLGRAQGLQLGADYGKVPSVEKVLKALAGLPRSDFAEMIHQGNGTFNSIPELAVERMAQVIQGEWGCHSEWGHPARGESSWGHGVGCRDHPPLQPSLGPADLRADLARTAEKVQSIADGFPLPDYTRPVSEALEEAEHRSQPYLREAERFEHYRWIAGTVLCSIILLILACNVMGMALGTYGLSKREDPSDYECRGEAGAKFLLVGVGLAFLFSWLLILLVFATFLVGGNIQTLVCRNWVNQEIYKFIDTPGNLPPSMNLTRQLNLRRDSNLSSAYRECKSGAGLWEVLQLDSSYDLDEHLKAPKYTADFQKRLGDFTADLGEVRLLRSEGRQDLETFARSGVDEVDYGRFQEEMENPVVQTSLPGLARNLEGLQKMQRNSTVAGRLAAEARALWHMQNSTVQSQEALVAKLGESVQFLSHLAPHLKERVRRTLATTASVEARLPVQAQQILRQELGCFTRKELRYFSQYLNWVGQTLREDVASCQPLATALDNGRVILCDRIAEPWNAFWFSLGCCTFFLIPSIIFAVRLTKHFRPIRNRLISTGSEETCPFHIPRVTALKL